MEYSSGYLRAAWQGMKKMTSTNQCANEISCEIMQIHQGKWGG